LTRRKNSRIRSGDTSSMARSVTTTPMPSLIATDVSSGTIAPRVTTARLDGTSALAF
jgi:hypothetical protein